MKSIPDEPEDDVDFEGFFTNLEEEGGDVDWLDDPDGTIRCMTFASRTMLTSFHSSNPPLIQLHYF